MRLWHKDLIPVLPKQQLLGQWRECCLIAKNIAEKGTPNHLLVNKIMDYPIDHFCTYCTLICIEMESRGYRADFSRLEKWLLQITTDFEAIPYKELFKGWHNDRYLTQCYCNLQEKHDCAGISTEEWHKVDMMYNLRYTKKTS